MRSPPAAAFGAARVRYLTRGRPPRAASAGRIGTSVAFPYSVTTFWRYQAASRGPGRSQSHSYEGGRAW